MGSCSASPLGRLVEETTVSSIFFSFWFLVSGLCFRVWSSDFRILGVYWPLVAVNSRPPETSKYHHLTLCSQILVLPPRHSQKWSDAPKRSQALPDVPRRRQDVGVCLASCWSKELHQNVAEHILGSRVKSSGNLRGQSEQNFEIYTVDWSQVSGWGLAAGGEALR